RDGRLAMWAASPTVAEQLHSTYGPDFFEQEPGVALSVDLPSGRALIEGRTIVIDDLAELVHDEHFDPGARAHQAQVGIRSQVSVPLTHLGQAIGVLNVGRDEARPFSDRQIALLQTFADQAVIAIENARLFSELNESNASLREALEQQTAT